MNNLLYFLLAITLESLVSTLLYKFNKSVKTKVRLFNFKF